MKANSTKIDLVIDALKKGSCNAVLLHGTDRDLVNHFFNLLLQSLGLFCRKIELDATSCEEAVSVFYNLNLFGRKECIRVQVGSRHVSDMIKNSLLYDLAHVPVFVGYGLSKDNDVRRFFEREKALFSVACYEDKDFENAIRKACRQYKIEKDAVLYLISNLDRNRFSLSNEIEKLDLLSQSVEEISLQNVHDISTCGSHYATDELFFSLEEKDARRYFSTLKAVTENKIADITLLRSLLHYYLKLVYVLHSNDSIEAAVAKLKPPIFFRYLDRFITIAHTISKERLKKMLDLIYVIEIQLKSLVTGRVLFENVYCQANVL
ncbi:DNA polymerase III subunit delta [Candidatus Sneabacter namystus]|uniref:DNA-directed DNA polymerase n=1 Tax=Candidatus Sneabacter namystus TaxID=2601646 RepID=A0A5C0UJ41_9RICK|nr:hypothetical protein [Candidatus Sneabacter namystus]QEK39807.1 hypothetical protein FZC37_02635 [Candidatus Sneabacter namystus]